MNPITAIDQLRDVLRRQHKALSTEDSYVFWLRHYISAVKSMPADLSSEQKLERFLTDLARRRNLSASSQNQALNAVVFFYKEVLHQEIKDVDALRASRPAHLRHAPTVAETQALLSAIPNHGGYPTNLIARMIYGCGLRVTEPLNLRIKDLDLDKGTLFIVGAKGGKDRVVSLPKSLVPEILQQKEFAKAVWQQDQIHKIPVELPHQLAAKYPSYQFYWPWAWLFPSRQTCFHPHTHLEVRFRMHEANVQRAVRDASRKLGIAVLPHELRHGYATHCMEQGISPRAIQKAMGHSSLDTTMGYLHSESLSVRSPLDSTMRAGG